MISYVNVDYPKINEIIKKRGTNRSQCALAIGINPGTLANAFRRNSKMRLDQMKMLANFLQVAPLELIPKDENGNPTYSDWEKATSFNDYASIDRENDQILFKSLMDLFSYLNDEGKAKLYDLTCEASELIRQIPKYVIDAPDPTTEKEL